MKIGFIYYTFYPVTNGAAVHGYNLAKELSKLGHKLYKLNGDPDPYTEKKKNRITGLFWMLRNCDVMYIRMDFFLSFRNLITIISLLAGKKIVVELNSPSDELHLFGRGRRYIKIADRVMGFILKRVDAVVVINDIVKEYTENTMGLSNVYVIDNGGEVFDNNPENVEENTLELITSIKIKYGKIVVWTGSGSKMHDFERLKKIAISLGNRAAVLLLVKVEDEELPSAGELDNLFILKNLKREDVRYIVANSDVGLTFYSSFSWSRWGYYGSSTKTYEYLNNGLLTLSNITGTKQQRKYPNFKYVESFDDIILSIKANEQKKPLSDHVRTWEDTGKETDKVIQKVKSD